MMVRMNPQLNELMERNPAMARILEDPETMQQAMRAAANPELMREMIRNQDRAMGNLDAMPGGHAALSQMHSDFIDPLYNAMSGSNTSTNASGNAGNYAQNTE